MHLCPVDHGRAGVQSSGKSTLRSESTFTTSHIRVTRQQEWKSRSFSDVFEYIQLVWLCIRTADFTLNFKTVVERQTFDHLNAKYKKVRKGADGRLLQQQRPD